MAADDIFGTNLGLLKVKTKRRASPEVMETRIEITTDMKEGYMKINLSLETIFLNKVAFVMKIPNNLKCITANLIPNMIQ